MLRNLGVLLLGVCLLVGCGKPAGPGGSPSTASASNGSEFVTITEDMVTEMKSIHDEASAKVAAPKLEALAERHKVFRDAMKAGKAPTMTPEDGERQGKAMEAYGAEMVRISNDPPAAMQLQGFIKKMGE